MARIKKENMHSFSIGEIVDAIFTVIGGKPKETGKITKLAPENKHMWLTSCIKMLQEMGLEIDDISRRLNVQEKGLNILLRRYNLQVE
jgi:hypothetical protein